MSDKTLTIYQGEDQSPATDITEFVAWDDPSTEFAYRAWLGEGSTTTIRFRDEQGRTGERTNLPAGITGLSLAAHNVVTWVHGSNTMWRGRIGPKDYTRGAQVAGRYREASIQLADYNVDLHNIVVHDWARPEETDVARVQGLLAAYLSGSPRATTNLNGSNFMSGSNTVTLPARTYERSTTFDVLNEIASFANKTFFVTVDGELFYDGHDSTTYVCPFKLSDRVSDVEADPTHVFYSKPRSTEDGQRLLSGVWLFYQQDKFVHVTNPSLANAYSWWEEVVYDDTVVVESQATTAANAILARNGKEQRTYVCEVGPLEDRHVGSIKPGMLIQVRAMVIPDADDQYVTRRISELHWQEPLPGQYFATLTLDRPQGARGGGQGPGQPAATSPKPAPVCVPGDDSVVYAPDTEVEYEGDGWPSFWQDAPFNSGEEWADNFVEPDGAMRKTGTGSASWGHSNAFLNGALTPGNQYRISLDLVSKYSWSGNPKEINFRFYDDASDTNLVQTVTLGPFTVVAKTPKSVSVEFTAPTYHHVDGSWPTSLTALYKNVTITALGSEAECPPGSIDYVDDDITAPGVYMPAEEVIARDDALQDQIENVAEEAGNTHISATADPTATDWDYAIGTVWVNTSSDEVFILVDDTEDAAIWQELGDVVGGGSGSGSYAETIGDGAETSFAISHGLGSTDVTVHLYDLTGADPVEATADASSITVTDDDTVTVVFGSAPGTDGYRVVVFAAGATLNGMPVARVRRSTDWTTEADNDPVEFDVEQRDTHGFWTSGEPTRLTIPAEFDGFDVILSFGAIWASGTGYREVKIYRNGDTTDPVAVQQVPGSSVGNTGVHVHSAPITVASGDYFQAAALSDTSKTALAHPGIDGDYSLVFSIIVLAGSAGSSAGAAATERRILLADGRSTPFAFTDMLQMDDGSDFMWSD